MCLSSPALASQTLHFASSSLRCDRWHGPASSSLQPLPLGGRVTPREEGSNLVAGSRSRKGILTLVVVVVFYRTGGRRGDNTTTTAGALSGSSLAGAGSRRLDQICPSRSSGDDSIGSDRDSLRPLLRRVHRADDWQPFRPIQRLDLSPAAWSGQCRPGDFGFHMDMAGWADANAPVRGHYFIQKNGIAQLSHGKKVSLAPRARPETVRRPSLDRITLRARGLSRPSRQCREWVSTTTTTAEAGSNSIRRAGRPGRPSGSERTRVESSGAFSRSGAGRPVAWPRRGSGWPSGARLAAAFQPPGRLWQLN